MNDSIDYMIEVLTAFRNGADIECKKKYPGCDWYYSDKPTWNWLLYDYRIKKNKMTITVLFPKNLSSIKVVDYAECDFLRYAGRTIRFVQVDDGHE